jgi:DNA-binding beta-propeller fold protein YncE
MKFHPDRVRSPMRPAGACFARRLSSWSVIVGLLGCSEAANLTSPELEDVQSRLELIDPSVALSIALPGTTDPMFVDLDPPADAPRQGMWSPVHDWPLNGLHAALLPDGRVLSYGTPSGAPATQDGRTFDVWDPAQGFVAASHRTTFDAQQVNSFCAGATFLSDGSLLISGGNSPLDSSVLAPATGSVTTSAFRMASERWYGTLITLPDGRALMMGGSGPYAALRAHQNPAQAINAGTVSMTPEIYEPESGFRSLFGAFSREAFGPDHHRYWYPRAWVAPNGQVFGISSEKMWYLDYSGEGSVEVAGDFKTGVNTTTRPNIGPTSSAVMFAPGRILQVGGNGYYDGHATPSSALATVVDINGPAPIVIETNPMSIARQWANATVLPDGTVVVTGGTRRANNGGADSAFEAELYNPESGTWTLGARAAVVRVYHSAAILMPNGTVLSTGGGAPGPVNNLNAEVYYPPYLFRPAASGGAELAPRPRALAVSTLSPAYGDSLNIDVASATPIQKVALIGTSSVTHSFNTSQRRLELPFVQSGGRVALDLPADAVHAPPGYYHVFLLDAAGVPSAGLVVSLGLSTKPAPVLPALPRGAEISLQSLNFPDSVMATDAQSLGVLQAFADDASEAELLPARFMTREGLADANCVSFESVAAPGLWLRHFAFRLGLGSNDGTALFSEDATFCPEAGLAGSGLSFRSKNFPGRVIRHRDRQLWLDPVSTQGSFPADATFSVRRPALPTLPSVAAAVSPAGSTVEYAPAVSAPGASFSWDFGDGSPPTPESFSPETSHVYAEPGVYLVTLTLRMADGRRVTKSFVQAVRGPTPSGVAQSSSLVALSSGPSLNRLWVVNPDADSLTAFDADSLTRIAELPVCAGPRSVAVVSDQSVWVACRDDASIAVVDPASFSVSRRLELPEGSRPYGLVLSPTSDVVFVSLDGLGRVLAIDAASGSVLRSIDAGDNPRGLALTPDGARLLVSRFISPPVAGEATGNPRTDLAAAEVRVVDVATATEARLVRLVHGNRVDSSVQGRGVPNYLAAPVVSPDGARAWVPSKQDNIARGVLRDGQGVDFQNTVRAVASVIDLGAEVELLGARLDFDDSGVAASAAFHPSGVYLFVALETSREVAVVDAIGGVELFRIDVGRAPQALVPSADGRRLFVHNFMDRSVSVIDLSALVESGEFETRVLATLSSVTSERLPAQVLLGKQLFYDAKDPRLARDAYLSCASCHAEGAHDGRVWDLTGQGEGLRNTISLVGRAGATRRLLHWSANFDEVQDFEGQIRGLSGGTGLLPDAVFGSGTIREPLGDPKAGLSPELDALAAYLTALTRATPSPFRDGDQLTAEAALGREVFVSAGCNACHYGATFSDEARGGLQDIGTLASSSGQRLFAPLVGINVPPLLDAWGTAPYLHDGSASSLAEAILAHDGVSLSDSELIQLVAFVRQIDDREPGLARIE